MDDFEESVDFYDWLLWEIDIFELILPIIALYLIAYKDKKQ